MLLSDGRFEVGITYGPGQAAPAERVARGCHRNAVIVPEMESLKQYMAFIRYVDLYVGGDTGPMHIASALDTAVVAIFGGTHAAQHAPLRSPSICLEADWVTEKRGVVRGEEAQKRLRSITPQKVYDACVTVMGGVAANAESVPS
jgi:ADP-heptose:LPS heptosyltransferase